MNATQLLAQDARGVLARVFGRIDTTLSMRLQRRQFVASGLK
jgi:hypothetical protein